MRSEISQRVKYNTEKSVNLGYSKALFQKTKIKSIFFRDFNSLCPELRFYKLNLNLCRLEA